ncbi:kelch-like protein 38 [Paramacrobiotus metropolitanus]|uniref:kelch-like protein 38 n=1 Tax=Paramacrobiotus metropolitanus TaxID=2943436 RepID=UPI0024464A89|nr:kelch-like protein 38 [Paramacrobiotus metropolitanus]
MGEEAPWPSCLRPSRSRYAVSAAEIAVKLPVSEFAVGLEECRWSFCDVSVCGKVDDSQKAEWISCHRIVLMARSALFRRMLSSPMQESKQDKIPLDGVTHNSLKQLISAMYSGEITVNGSNALYLLQAADYVGMQTVMEACKAFLLQNVGLQTG